MCLLLLVALLTEGVDRNVTPIIPQAEGFFVALLTEGVDRNRGRRLPICWAYVALLTEGVDRNGGVWGRRRAGAVALLTELSLIHI